MTAAVRRRSARARRRALAVLAPILAFTLLMPPFIDLIASAGSAPGGVRPLLLYLFGLWLLCIVAAACLARALRQDRTEGERAAESGEP